MPPSPLPSGSAAGAVSGPRMARQATKAMNSPVISSPGRMRWLGQYGARRDATVLADRPRSGRPRQSSRLPPRRLAAALARDPRRCGYQATSWTVPLLAHDLTAKGIAVSPRTLRRRLHEAGYRWKRPRYVYAGRATHLAQKKGRWSGA